MTILLKYQENAIITKIIDGNFVVVLEYNMALAKIWSRKAIWSQNPPHVLDK